MVKVTLWNHENIRSYTRHPFLQHWHLSLTNVTWLLLTTPLLLTASLEEVRIPAGAPGHRQERCPTGRECWGQSTHCHTILSIKTIEATSKRMQNYRQRRSISPGPPLPFKVGDFSSWSHSRKSDQSILSASFEPSLHCHLGFFPPCYISSPKMGPWAALQVFSLVPSAINYCLKCETILAPPLVN